MNEEIALIPVGHGIRGLRKYAYWGGWKDEKQLMKDFNMSEKDVSYKYIGSFFPTFNTFFADCIYKPKSKLKHIGTAHIGLSSGDAWYTYKNINLYEVGRSYYIISDELNSCKDIVKFNKERPWTKQK